ncbi:hypothetical protein [Hyunsoonleella pacifica]|uniref:DUF975 family protein n=1 Tax=Hyunsoonleella pacifica TaxID=1080224 RepID=A0A4V2JAR9_9FLAO|nr:hypothetical protein [Hyunsoonleella pacifica]TBN14438.1 hypothetical protein EYD46_12760 [Hyunsoonleella pacifica]GGD13751.1 hypothetical protein GCM10011368_14650 [Hyunsoonleella pacifica]
MNTIDILLDKIETAKELDFGTIFSDSIELFKKVWVQGLVILLLSMLFMLPFYLLMYVPFIGMGIMDPESFNNGGEPNFAVMLPFYGMMIVFSFFAMIIGVGLKAAFFRICKHKDADENANDDYLYFFKRPYLGKTIKVGAATFLIIIISYMLCFFPIIYAVVPISIINVIYAFNPDLSVSEIVKAGFKLGNKKWLITFGLMIVAGFLAGLVGMLMCFIGIIATSSFSYIPLYMIYKESVGFDDKSEIEQIGSGE